MEAMESHALHTHEPRTAADKPAQSLHVKLRLGP